MNFIEEILDAIFTLPRMQQHKLDVSGCQERRHVLLIDLFVDQTRAIITAESVRNSARNKVAVSSKGKMGTLSPCRLP
jgi:hypothetical protein